MEEEFDDALVETDGVKCNPCDECEKVGKSKGGLTRRFHSKHGKDSAKQSLILASSSFDTVALIVELITTIITEETLCGPEMSNTVKTATVSFFDGLYPLFATFCIEKNQDKLVVSFFA